MPFEDALKQAENGVIIQVEVTPGSRNICIPSGYNPWRKRIEVRLSENARKGKANEQLIENIAALFDLKPSDVAISSGHKSTRKSVLVKGIDISRVISVLKASLEGAE